MFRATTAQKIATVATKLGLLGFFATIHAFNFLWALAFRYESPSLGLKLKVEILCQPLHSVLWEGALDVTCGAIDHLQTLLFRFLC